MSSWGPGFIQKRGHMILPYYHFVGFGDYAIEFFKLVRSMYYSYLANEFLFVFDKVNSISPTFPLFELTLKKNNSSRYLSYYPSQGFNICDRRDLLEPLLKQPTKIDKVSFFSFFSMVFDLQTQVKEKIVRIYERKKLTLTEQFNVGVCLIEGQQTYDAILERIKKLANRPIDPVSVFVNSASRDEYIKFREQCPSNWTISSMWETIPPIIVTEEQKIDTLYAFLGSLILLSHCPHIIGSFKNSSFLFLYCKEERFRIPSNVTIVDGSSFSYF